MLIKNSIKILKRSLRLAIYPSVIPQKIFKYSGFLSYKFYVKINNLLFYLLPFSKEFFYKNSNSKSVYNESISGCYELSPLSRETSNNLIKYFDQYIIFKRIKNNKLGNGVDRLSFTINLNDSELKKNLSFIDYSNLKLSFESIKKKIMSLGPFDIEPKLIVQKLICTGKDIGDTNTILHIDRYVPSLKAFIFLTDTEINGSPYEHVPKSHLINKNYMKEYFIESKKHILSKSPIYPFSITANKNPAKRYGYKGQTIISAVNGLHRRVPFFKEGNYRYTIRFVLYNSISLKAILRNYLNQLFL